MYVILSKIPFAETVSDTIVVCCKIFLDRNRENKKKKPVHLLNANLEMELEFKQSIWAYSAWIFTFSFSFFFFSLPKVCLHYNKGDGPYGSCTFKKMCTKLHVCQYFLRGQCRFGSSCKRSHDFSKPECCEKLERQGMSSDIIQKLPSIYRNMYAIQNSKGSKHDTEDNKSLLCKGKYIIMSFENIRRSL